jgi:hypothetical protein
VEIEADDGAVVVGAAAEFAVVVHPGACALHDLAFADLDGTGWAFLRDLGEYVAAGFAVVTGVLVHHGFFWKARTNEAVICFLGQDELRSARRPPRSPIPSSLGDAEVLVGHCG